MEDIKRNGQRDPIVMTEGMVLDGRNRYQACHFLGVEPITTQWEDTSGLGPVAYVVSKNIHRRHLDPGQRALIWSLAKSLNEEIEERARRRQQSTAIKDGKPPVSANLRSPQPSKASDEIAKLSGASSRTQEHAKRVVDSGVPELVEAVKNGSAAVSAASEITSLPADRIRQIIAEDRVAEEAAEIRRSKRGPKERAQEASSHVDFLVGEFEQLMRAEQGEFLSRIGAVKKGRA